MRTITFPRFFGFGILLFLGCGGAGPVTVLPCGGLYGTTWRLDRMEDDQGEVILRVDSSEIFEVHFERDGSVEVNDPCHACRGTWQAGEGVPEAISIDLTCPAPACDPTPGYSTYAEDLARAYGFARSGDDLLVVIPEGPRSQYVLVHRLVDVECDA